MPELSVFETARHLGVSIDAVYSRLYGGQLSGRKDEDGKWRIPKAAVEDWRKRRERRRTAVVEAVAG